MRGNAATSVRPDLGWGQYVITRVRPAHPRASVAPVAPSTTTTAARADEERQQRQSELPRRGPARERAGSDRAVEITAPLPGFVGAGVVRRTSRTCGSSISPAPAAHRAGIHTAGTRASA